MSGSVVILVVLGLEPRAAAFVRLRRRGAALAFAFAFGVRRDLTARAFTGARRLARAVFLVFAALLVLVFFLAMRFLLVRGIVAVRFGCQKPRVSAGAGRSPAFTDPVRARAADRLQRRARAATVQW